MRLQDVCTVFSDGDWIESKDQSNKGIRLVQTGNIGEGLYLEKEERAKYVSEEIFESLKCTEIYPGDILISRLPEPVGRACIIPPKKERMITAVDCTICRVDESIVSKEYLCYFMRSNAYYTKLLGSVTGTTRKRISRKNLGNIELEIPPKEEQTDVVSQLECLINVINSRNKELQLFDNLIKARFVEMFGDVIHNDRKWECKQFSDITTSRLGKMLDAKHQTGTCKYPYLANFNVQWFRFELDNLNEMDFNEKDREEFCLEDGDLLVCEGGEIGRCAVWHNQVKKCFFQKALHRVRCNQDIILPDYLAWWFKYNCENGGFAAIEGAKATISHLTGVKMKMLDVTVPAIELQEQFADFIKQVDKSKVVYQIIINKLTFLQKICYNNYKEQYYIPG